EGTGGKRVWRSNRGKPTLDTDASGRGGAIPDSSSLRPMLASSTSDPPERGEWVFEPKYDGLRVLAFATAEAVALITRNGRDKARQFPELVEALTTFVDTFGRPVVLDGEIVSLENGRIARFERLQGRMHTSDDRRIARDARETPAAF